MVSTEHRGGEELVESLMIRKESTQNPTTAIIVGHVTAFTAAASQSVDFSRLKVWTSSPELAVDRLVSVTYAIRP